MTCHEARELFSGLVDDALGADERRALDVHLATCADCGRELQRFRSTVALLRSVEPARAPAGFVDRVLDAARPAPWPRRLLRALVLPWPLKLPVEAAAIVLVAVGVVYVFRVTPQLEQATRLESTYKTDTTTSQTETATTGSRDVASEPAAPPAPQEADRAFEKAPAPKDRLGENETAAPARARNQAEPPAAGLRDTARNVDRQKRPSTPPPTEPPVPGKLSAPPGRAERDRGVAQESKRVPASPAPEARADAQRAPQSARSSTALSVTPPDVSGRLAVADQTAALRGLAYLVDRLGAVENGRVTGDVGPIIEITVPREAYAEFMRELTRLGRWELTREAASLPAQVRVVLHITG
jgi:Putative zinc-finger